MCVCCCLVLCVSCLFVDIRRCICICATRIASPHKPIPVGSIWHCTVCSISRALANESSGPPVQLPRQSGVRTNPKITPTHHRLEKPCVDPNSRTANPWKVPPQTLGQQIPGKVPPSIPGKVPPSMHVRMSFPLFSDPNSRTTNSGSPIQRSSFRASPRSDGISTSNINIIICVIAIICYYCYTLLLSRASPLSCGIGRRRYHRRRTGGLRRAPDPDTRI